jgi:hypothetical protein
MLSGKRFEVNTPHAPASLAEALDDAPKSGRIIGILSTMPSRRLPNTYPEAQKLAVSRINTIEFNLSERSDLDDAGRRRIACACAWVVVYVYEDGSATKDEAPPAPATVGPA